MTTTLITGATGTVGNQLARELLQRGGMEVRVATRQPEAARDLAELGATVVSLDLDAIVTLEPAFDGVDQLFLVGPQSAPTFGEQVGAVVAAARRAGVRFVLRVSALGADADASFVLAAQHGVAEQRIASSGLDWATLRPTFFQDNVLNFQGQAIASQGAFYGASAGGKTAYVSTADIARTAAGILANPAPHHGATYVLTGPDAVSDTELAELISGAIGRLVKYVDVGPDQLRASMLERGMPAWIADSMVALEAVKANGYAAGVSSAVRDITARAPESYRAFLERNRNRLI